MANPATAPRTGYVPPFTVSAAAVSLIAEIAALARDYSLALESGGVRLRRENKARTIHSSLAIEGNCLSESQVTDILDGRPVVGPERDILEVRNARAVYTMVRRLDPHSVHDLLKAHAAMMDGLVDTAGHFRTCGVGVFAGRNLVHIAPPAERVPALIDDLFAWVASAPDHPLVKSCVFHYEFEFIHPFADGNGRMGRLWQSLLLGKWNPVFLSLPVESLVHDSQQGYYRAINASSNASDSGPFIDFMLGELYRALVAGRNESRGKSREKSRGKKDSAANRICVILKRSPRSTQAELASELGLSVKAIEKSMRQLREAGRLMRVGPKKGGSWKVL